MSKWKEYKLGEVVTFQRGYDLPKEKMIKGEFPVAGSNGVIGFHNEYTTDGPGVTIGRSGNIGIPHYYSTAYWAHNTVLYIKDFKGNNPKFIYYLLKTMDFTQFNTGSAVPSLNRNHIHELLVNIPSKDTQYLIASILTSLDDKIDLLNCENTTLESMAEILFRQSYIEEAERDWIDGKLGDLIVIKYGKDHKKLQEGNIPVIGSGGIMRYVDKYLHDKESVLIPRKGSLNNVMYINEPFWTVDTMFYTEMRRPNIAKYIYHVIKGLDLANMNVGSAVPSMTTEVLNNIPINIPPQIVFDKFEDSVLPLYTKIRENKKQISTLIRTRDELLPRLINKEIRI